MNMETRSPAEFWTEPRSEPDRILVVQSDPAVARRISEVLAGPGRCIRIVDRAEAAREIARSSPPDIFVLDVLLSDGDGRSLAAELRRIPSTRALPVVVTVPRGLGGIRGDLLGQGADAVLERPVDPDLLGAAVGSELRRGRNLRGSDRVDPLTGLLNRNGVAELFREEQGRGRDPGVALLEVEGFVDLAARLGWDGGERLLTQMAAVLDGRLGSGEQAGRWGGARFVLLGSGGDDADFGTRVQELQSGLVAHPFRDLDGRTFTIEVAAGVAGHDRGGFDRTLTSAEIRLRASRDGGDGTTQPSQGARTAGGSVLLFDPRDEAGDLLEARIVQEGIRVDRVGDVEEAGELLEGDLPRLAIVDHDVEPEAGRVLEVLEERGQRQVPVLLLTGDTREDRLVGAMRNGAVDWALKPVVPHELMERVRRLLS